jgi:hypothetical protein
MLVLHPAEAAWIAGGQTRALRDVERVTIERVASRFVIEHGDQGAHPAFADAPEQETRVTVLRRAGGAEIDLWEALRPGMEGTLRLRTAANASGAGALRVFVSAVVRAARVEARPDGGVRQRVEFVGVSPGGIDDPVSVVEGG